MKVRSSVRRICENCKQPMENIKDNVAKYLEKYGADPGSLYQGTGCDKCRQTGYKGRIGLYEILEVEEELRDMITRSPTLVEVRKAVVDAGMQTLREDGLLKVADGLTTIEEIMRVTET